MVSSTRAKQPRNSLTACPHYTSFNTTQNPTSNHFLNSSFLLCYFRLNVLEQANDLLHGRSLGRQFGSA